MDRLNFEDWRIEHGEEVVNLNDDDIINCYLEYYTQDKDKIITWGEGIILEDKDLNEEKLRDLISKYNIESISSFDYNEDHSISNIGQSMFTKICELYHSTNLPTHPDGFYESDILNIHPTVYKYLKEWIDYHCSIIGWDDDIKDLFWDCFINEDILT